MSKNGMSRREFVAGTTGAALGATIIPRRVLGGAGYQPPSETVNFALVGCGGQGMADATELIIGGHNLVATVDVDFGYVDSRLARLGTGFNGKPNPDRSRVQEAYGKARRYADFRKMLEASKDIDGVLIATPDHTHAIIAKAAMEAGKHVYVEKPMAWSVHEARVLRETAQRTKLVTQMGNQGHSSDGAARINELVQSGILGPVHEVFVWTNRPIWPQGVPRPGKTPPPDPKRPGFNFGNEWTSRKLNGTFGEAMDGNYPVPPKLNWDLFLGPGAEVPYHPIYHPFNWRGWVEWGTGALGDMGAHLIDHPYWALGLKHPTSIEATSTPFGLDASGNPASYPMAMQCVYHFPARGNQPPVKMTWLDGGLMPPRPEALPETVPLDRGGGVLIVGEKGVLMHGTYGANPVLFPLALREEGDRVPKTHPRPAVDSKAQGGSLHRINWANAIKGKANATCPFEYAGPLVETMLLGVVALKTGQGKVIRYDGDSGKITNLAEDSPYLEREYRKGWTL